MLGIPSSARSAQAADLSPRVSSRDQADSRKVRASITWTGASDARWSNPANWDSGRVPSPSDLVHLTGSAETQIDAAFSDAVAGLVLAPDFSGTVRLGRDLRVRGDVVIQGGTFLQGEHALTAMGWTQTHGQFVGGSAPLTITESASETS